MATTVLSCPKCRAPVRLREGETKVQCTGCGATVSMWDKAVDEAPAAQEGAGDRLRQAVLVGSLLILAGAFVTLATMRRHRGAQARPVVKEAPIYTAPPNIAVAPAPAGEVAWEANARAPVVAAINADGVEDVFGFFRVWDGTSAWIAYAGAFDGATLKPLWRSEAIDPQLVKQAGVLPMAIVLGSRILVADSSPTLRVYTLATGEKQTTLKLSGPVARLCRSPDQPARVWARVVGDGDTMLDLDSGKSTLAPRPKWCPASPDEPPVTPKAKKVPVPIVIPALIPPPPPRTRESIACMETFINGAVAEATCHAPELLAGPAAPRVFRPGYVLTDGTLTVALGTKDDLPFAVSRTKATPWIHPFVTDDTKAKPRSPAVAELAQGRLYAVYDKVYFDARVAVLDARTGQTVWEAPLVGSLPGTEGLGRGEARGLVATAARVYVVRAGGGLDIFDASSGKAIGTIGKQ